MEQAVDPSGFVIMPPADELAPFVRRYMYVNRALDEPLVLRPKPTGYMYVSNAFGDTTGDFIEVDGERSPRSSRWYFAGQIVEHRIVVSHASSARAAYAELTASGLFRLFGLPGTMLTGRAMALDAAGATFGDLARRCFVTGAEGSPDEHIDEMNTFFAELARHARAPDAEVEQAIALFEAANGAVRVADVCRTVGLGPRQLNRRFTHVVGIPPKFFGQILQINWVVGLLYGNDLPTLTAIAHAAGFYDLAHFNHAMQRFFNEGPRDFLRSRHVAFETFLGASRRFGPAARAGLTSS